MQDHTWMRGIHPLRPYCFSLFGEQTRSCPGDTQTRPSPLLLGSQGIEDMVYNWLLGAQLGAVTSYQFPELESRLWDFPWKLPASTESLVDLRIPEGEGLPD